MKKIYFLFVLFFISMLLRSQVPVWAWANMGVGGIDEDSRRMCVDASGNVFVTGMFTSHSATFATTTVTNSSTNGTADFFLAKYDGTGNLLWIRTATGTGYDKGLSVTTDPSGNAYVTGAFESPSITFGTITFTNNSSLSDIFVVKYNSSGTVIWAKGYGGSQQDVANGIAVDASGNSYITGGFYSLSVLFGSFGVINSGSNDGFVTKFDVNGIALWTDQIGGSLVDEGLDIKADASGIYVVGAFSSPTLSAYAPNMVNAGGTDIFFAKYDSNGNVLASRHIGGPNNEQINSLALDATGNIYMTGYFESTSLAVGTINLSNSVTRSMLVAKLNSGGTVLWANSHAGNNFSYPTSLAADASGNLYVAGSFNLSTLTFGSNSITNPSSSLNGFLVKYNASTGSSTWAMAIGSTLNETIQAMAVDQAGSIYLSGTFGPTLTLGDFTLNGVAASDLFFGKLCDAPATPVTGSDLVVCNKASGILTATPPGGAVVNWYNAATGGTLLLAGSNSYTAASTGTFYVGSKSTAGCNSPVRAVVTLSVRPGAVVSITGKTLTANAGTTYQWIECNKDSVLTSQTGQNLVLPYTGNFAVIVNANGCTDTSACNFYSISATSTVVVTSIAEEVLINTVSIYPNPNNGSFTIRTKEDARFTLLNSLGQMVRRVMLSEENDHNMQIEGLAVGLYFMRNEADGRTYKIIVGL